MEASARIEQLKRMAEADPDNELGHFSLGRAFLDAGRFNEAVAALERATELNPNLSKAYQFMAQALLQLDMKDAAVARLSQGAKIADDRGDLMPRNEMVRMLKELGATPPEFKRPDTSQPVGTGQVLCKRCGQVGPQLAKPPFKNQFGQDIFEGTCQPCWREAIGMGTKVINELRLPLADPQAQKVWDQHIREFLNL